MAVSAAIRDHVCELFAGLGDIAVKSMFGGAGIWLNKRMFGLLAGERIYLKTSDQTRPAFEAEGSKPFTFKNKNGAIVAMSYLELPTRLLDDPDEAVKWARQACKVASASKKKKAKFTEADLPLVTRKKL